MRNGTSGGREDERRAGGCCIGRPPGSYYHPLISPPSPSALSPSQPLTCSPPPSPQSPPHLLPASTLAHCCPQPRLQLLHQIMQLGIQGGRLLPSGLALQQGPVHRLDGVVQAVVVVVVGGDASGV